MNFGKIKIDSSMRTFGTYSNFFVPFTNFRLNKAKISEAIITLPPQPYNLQKVIPNTSFDVYTSIGNTTITLFGAVYSYPQLINELQTTLAFDPVASSLSLELLSPAGNIKLQNTNPAITMALQAPAGTLLETLGFTGSDLIVLTTVLTNNIVYSQYNIDYPILGSKMFIDIANIHTSSDSGIFNPITNAWYMGSIDLPYKYDGGEILHREILDDSFVFDMSPTDETVEYLNPILYTEGGRVVELDNDWSFVLTSIKPP